MKKVEDLSNKAQAAATKTEADAQRTAEDRAEVGKMLETVKDVSEQVKTVDESVRKAKESEQAAEGHRTAVEEMKNSVEQTVSGITQVVQTGVQEINSAKQSAVQEVTQTGTAQKTAVEGAGTQAVESVDNAKITATEAVEIAKTEAVQAVQAEGTKQVKAVQDKGAEVLQSIPEDFQTQMETKLNKQQGIENKGKVLVIGEDGNVVPEEVASGGGDGIAIINTMSGESPLVIPDSAERVNKRLELSGKTEQVTTTGAQLFDASKYEGVTKNGVTVTVKDGVITATGTPNINTWIQVFVSRENYQKLFKPENKIYLKTNKSKDCNYDFGIYGAFGSPIIGTIREGNSGRVLPAELPRNDTDFYFFIDVKIGTELKGSIKPIVYHDGDGTWEPYTGGKPSPSPEYPQEIKNSGKWNEETQKYEVDVKITGKNLFDIEKAEASGGNLCTAKRENNIVKITAIETVTSKRAYAIVSGGGICLKAGKTYFLNGRKVGTSNMTPMFAFFKEKNIGELLKLGNFYTPNEDIYIDIGIYLVGDAIGTGDTLEITDIIVCEGKDVAQYQPYTEQTLTITSDRPITKWDRLVEQGGEIGWLYAGVVIDRFDGQSNKISIANKKGDVQNFSIQFDNVPNGNGNTDIFIDKYRAVQLSYTKAEYGICCNWNDGVKYFSAPNKNVATVDEFKAWLVENPLKIAYETTNPEFIPLPQSEQNAIRALKTYYPTTVITADGGELDPDIKVTYTADTKNYIDNKVSAKVASIIRQYRLNTANLLSLMPMETQAAMIENDTGSHLRKRGGNET